MNKLKMWVSVTDWTIPEGDVYVEVENSVLIVSSCLIANCLSGNLGVNKIYIPTCGINPVLPVRVGLYQYVRYSQKKADTLEKLVEYLNIHYPKNEIILCPDAAKAMKEYYDKKDFSLAGQLEDQLHSITGLIGANPDCGKVFYSAWNGAGDRKNFPISEMKRVLSLLTLHGYSVRFQSTSLVNNQYPGRKSDPDNANYVLQTTVVFHGIDDPRAVVTDDDELLKELHILREKALRRKLKKV